MNPSNTRDDYVEVRCWSCRAKCVMINPSVIERVNPYCEIGVQ